MRGTKNGYDPKTDTLLAFSCLLGAGWPVLSDEGF